MLHHSESPVFSHDVIGIAFTLNQFMHSKWVPVANGTQHRMFRTAG